jgi:hypothetical protein
MNREKNPTNMEKKKKLYESVVTQEYISSFFIFLPCFLSAKQKAESK